MIINLLPFVAALNGISFPLGNYHFRLEQVLSCILFAILMVKVIIVNKLYLDSTNKLILIVSFLHILSSLFFAPHIKFSIFQTFSLMSVWFIPIILTNLLDNFYRIVKFIKFFLIAGFLEIVYGILLYVLSTYLGYNLAGANVFRDPGVVEALGIQGTLIEPNIFGSYCLPFFLISITLLFFDNNNHYYKRYYLVLLLLFSMVGIIMSFTRGAWIGGIVGIIMIVLLNMTNVYNNLKKNGAYLLIGCFVILGIFILIIDYLPESYFKYKISNIISISESNVVQRLNIWEQAIKNIKESIIFGNGTYSFASINNSLGFYHREENPWIGNVFVTILHDSGIIGLLFFIILCIDIIVKGTYSFKILIKYNNIMGYTTMGLVASFIALFVSFMFTMASSAAYPWIVIGLIGSINRYARTLCFSNASS